MTVKSHVKTKAPKTIAPIPGEFGSSDTKPAKIKSEIIEA